jgi:ABC-type transport system substrate-binding protein
LFPRANVSSAIFILPFAICHLQFLSLSPSFAQPPKSVQQQEPEQPQELLDRTPFDQIILKEDAKPLEVSPLELSQRPLASLPAAGALKVRLLDRPAEQFEVSFSSIAKIRVFEELLLDEARRLAATGDFDKAYDYFGRLLREYPSYPGLNAAINDYLRRNALALYQSQQYDRALALLITLHQRDPKLQGLGGAVSTVAGEIIERYLREGKYAAARGVLELWQTRFAGLANEKAADWRSRFESAATRQLNEATQFLRQKNYIAARRAVSKALAIWPKLPAATNVSAQIEREFPFVAVGVLEPTPHTPIRRIDSWPAMRGNRLTQRLLVEEVDFGAEGGIYQSPLGDLQIDETGRRLKLTLNPASGGNPTASTISPDALARYLLAATKPTSPYYRPDFADQVAGIAIAPDTVEIEFNRVQVRPEAYLQIPPPAGEKRFAVAEQTTEQTVFSAPKSAKSQEAGIRAIVERVFTDDESAVAALISGEIDVLDRVPPWQIDRLSTVEGVRVESYRLPTIHVLVPNVSRPLLAKRELRRALCFGIDRRWIVHSVLLGGATKAGFEVISGPFPVGLSLSDSLRYAYNNRIAPRPFEPRLAAILATIAWAGVQNPSGKKEDAPPELPPMPELTLAHPKDPIARIACQSIQMQLDRAGISVKLVEFSPEELLADKVECDLRYAEIAVWEPLIDTRPLIGPGGLAGNAESPYLQTALRAVDEATNWNDVRARLADVHEIAYHELPLIPLWQTVNYFAYRTSLHGIGDSPVALYQNVEAWSTQPASDVARLQPTAR